MVLNFPIIDKNTVKERPVRKTNHVNLLALLLMRGIYLVIDAVTMVEDANFNLAGWTNNELLNRMKSQKGWDKVKFFGKLSKNEVTEKVHAHSDIGVALYHYSPLCHGKVEICQITNYSNIF